MVKKQLNNHTHPSANTLERKKVCVGFFPKPGKKKFSTCPRPFFYAGGGAGLERRGPRLPNGAWRRDPPLDAFLRQARESEYDGLNTRTDPGGLSRTTKRPSE
jgi:hypothetical protein